jgi:hypothetical protein
MARVSCADTRPHMAITEAAITENQYEEDDPHDT